MPFGNGCPGGTHENSPAFQRWDACHANTSPEGTAERRCRRVLVQPSLRDSISIDHDPGVETPGIIGMSLRDKLSSNFRTALSANPDASQILSTPRGDH